MERTFTEILLQLATCQRADAPGLSLLPERYDAASPPRWWRKGVASMGAYTIRERASNPKQNEVLKVTGRLLCAER